MTTNDGMLDTLNSSPRMNALTMKRTYSGRAVTPRVQETCGAAGRRPLYTGRDPPELVRSLQTSVGSSVLGQSYSEMSKSLNIDEDCEERATEGQEQHMIQDSIDLHSVNHLRSVGESRRFTDELNYVLEGFGESGSIALHRARYTANYLIHADALLTNFAVIHL